MTMGELLWGSAITVAETVAHPGPSASRTADIEESQISGDTINTSFLDESIEIGSVPGTQVTTSLGKYPSCEALHPRLNSTHRHGAMGKCVLLAIIAFVLVAIIAPCLTFYLLLKVCRVASLLVLIIHSLYAWTHFDKKTKWTLCPRIVKQNWYIATVHYSHY